MVVSVLVVVALAGEEGTGLRPLLARVGREEGKEERRKKWKETKDEKKNQQESN